MFQGHVVRGRGGMVGLVHKELVNDSTNDPSYRPFGCTLVHGRIIQLKLTIKNRSQNDMMENHIFPSYHFRPKPGQACALPALDAYQEVTIFGVHNHDISHSDVLSLRNRVSDERRKAS